MPYQLNLQQQIAKTLSPAHLKDPGVLKFLHLVNASYLNAAQPMPEEKNIDLRQLIYNIKVFNGINAELRGNAIRLVIDEAIPKFISANEVRLHRVLNNLVANAIQCANNSLITVTMHLQSINAEDITINFLLDYNENHGKKEPVFQFSLTFKPGNDPFYKEWTQLQGNKDLHHAHILLVEDVEYNVMIAEKMLTGWNARVDVANNGVEAITKARQNEYQIVLMDLQMPVLDGYSATRQIRHFNKIVPIVALTASAMPDIMKNDDIGLTDFLAKPFRPAALYDMVYKYTQKSA